MRWAGHVACMTDRRGAYRVLAGKHEGKRQLGKPRSRWEDNYKLLFTFLQHETPQAPTTV